MKRFALAVLVSGIWINISELVRNELLLKSHWLERYESLGVDFPSSPMNGAIWGLWGFIFAGCIVAVVGRYPLIKAAALCWTMGFVMMWVVVANLNVMPFSLLPIAIPWSLVETLLGCVLAQKIIGKPNAESAALQRNAGSRPPSNDSLPSETPSSLGPRG